MPVSNQAILREILDRRHRGEPHRFEHLLWLKDEKARLNSPGGGDDAFHMEWQCAAMSSFASLIEKLDRLRRAAVEYQEIVGSWATIAEEPAIDDLPKITAATARLDAAIAEASK